VFFTSLNFAENLIVCQVKNESDRIFFIFKKVLFSGCHYRAFVKAGQLPFKKAGKLAARACSVLQSAGKNCGSARFHRHSPPRLTFF